MFKEGTDLSASETSIKWGRSLGPDSLLRCCLAEVINYSLSPRGLVRLVLRRRLDILRLLADDINGHVVGTCAGRGVEVGIILVETRRGEVLERDSERLLLVRVLLVKVRLRHQGLHAAEVGLLLVEVGRLHRLEHVLVLAHHVKASILLQAIVKDA